MALDGLVLRAITHELQPLVGGRIHKIHQPTEHDIVMQIRAKGKNHKLLLSANPTYSRIHLTTRTYQNPLSAPMFCMLLRKHCEQGTVQAIKQIGLERIIHLDVRKRDELGDIKTKRIIIELMGRHSNIILIDPGKETVLDSIIHIQADKSRYRTVLPGSKYLPPPEQHKADPLKVDEEEMLSILKDLGNNPNANDIVARFTGISPLNAKEILYRSSQMKEANEENGLYHVFRQIMQQIGSHQYEPNIVDIDRKKTVFSVLSLSHVKGSVTSFASINQCTEAYYADKAARDIIKQKSGDLIKLLQNELQKNKKKKKILLKTIEEAKQADRFRIMGELLIANLHEIKKGDQQVEVINYYDPNQSMIKIHLDQNLNPSENAQMYFKRYNKQKNSLIHAEEQLKLTEQEIQYLETLLQQLEEAAIQDLEQIREELEQEGYVRRKQSRRQSSRKDTRPALLRFTSSEGVPIYVGKNNMQNEYLTHRFAHASDTWLHTKDIPGSHVIIRGKEYTEITLEEAAMIAAYYSKGKESSLVPVDYTKIRHVRKPSGAKPGFVIYDHQKTIFITPDWKKISVLKANQE